MVGVGTDLDLVAVLVPVLVPVLVALGLGLAATAVGLFEGALEALVDAGGGVSTTVSPTEKSRSTTSLVPSCCCRGAPAVEAPVAKMTAVVPVVLMGWVAWARGRTNRSVTPVDDLAMATEVVPVKPGVVVTLGAVYDVADVV